MKLGGAVAVAAAVLFFALGEGFGYVRTGVALVVALGLTTFGIRYLHFVLSSPPEPDVADVSDYGLRYVCTMCGLELKVEVAARDRAPTHCMEPMVLVRTGDAPP